MRDFDLPDGTLARAAFLPDGDRLILVGSTGATRIVDAKTGELLQAFVPSDHSPDGMEHPDAEQEFRDLAVSEKGVFLVTQSDIPREPYWEIDDDTLWAEAIEWQATRGSRSGRVAWQFFCDLAGRRGVSLLA